jgi:hypothetical protein
VAGFVCEVITVVVIWVDRWVEGVVVKALLDIVVIGIDVGI